MPAIQHLSGSIDKQHLLDEALFEHLGEISGILFFLLGAMTIVELIDVHDGFRVITDRITTTNRVKLLWVIAWVSFFVSAALDNMTTAIIMCALLRKMMKGKDDIWLFGGFVVIAANAGGAWSPIGDVTTIMLWIGGQVSTVPVMTTLFLPSMASLLVPLLVASYFLKGKVQAAQNPKNNATTLTERNLIFGLGCFGLLFVPVFKAITHYPPYLGVMLSLGIVWAVTELLYRNHEDEHKQRFSVATVLHRIDTPSILFFLGILLAVGALDTSGHLKQTAELLDEYVGNIYFINTIIGLLSAVVDNVPLVAAAMGMYPLSTYPADSSFWNLLAYCAGTGGSILIIGSAAGVASMSILKIDFLWYLKRISGYALVGYLAGIAVYYWMH
jgi:Na+/H+ antiporter NhaD/arsenite permease-like protein